MTRILIIGGYGAFGSRIAERLARDADLELILAGRSAARAEEEAHRLERAGRAVIRHAALDALRAGSAELRTLAPLVVVNASGPYQGRNYALAEACIGAGCHYVDMADGRTFVTGISVLDAAARKANVLVVSGASSVPGLSSAVVVAHAHEFKEITGIEIGISPGNSFDPGVATVASVLGGLGRPMGVRWGGETRIVYGWQGARRHRFPGLGLRWMGHVDVPDLDLFPARYPSLDTVLFKAGLEVPLFHLALWSLSWLARAGLVPAPHRLARPLLHLKRKLSFLGSDRGGMFVAIKGTGKDGRTICLTWHLIARRGHGAYVPAMPCAIVARRLASGLETKRGAMACFGLMTLDAFGREAADLDIATMTATADA